jgi:hypothetical protein
MCGMTHVIEMSEGEARGGGPERRQIELERIDAIAGAVGKIDGVQRVTGATRRFARRRLIRRHECQHALPRLPTRLASLANWRQLARHHNSRWLASSDTHACSP